MNYKFVAMGMIALLMITACGKKNKSALKWLPQQASSKEELQQNFPQSCVAGSREMFQALKVDESVLTDDFLQNGCGCTIQSMNAELTEGEWTDLIDRLSAHKQPKKALKKHLKKIFETCYRNIITNGG